MKVYVPATPNGLHPATLPALLRFTNIVKVVAVQQNELSYQRVLFGLWNSHLALKRPFCIVEHDVELVDDAIGEFTFCPEPWCCVPYQHSEYGHGPGDETLLGCTKFSPTVLGPLRMLPVSWKELDQSVYAQLHNAGFEPHVHSCRIVHHHNWRELERVAL